MKITDVKVWLVQGIKYNWTMLKIYTDEGYTGVGEATNWPGSPMIEAATRHAGERIIGMDPMRTDFIWTKLYRDLNWVGLSEKKLPCMPIIGLLKVGTTKRIMPIRHGR